MIRAANAHQDTATESFQQRKATESRQHGVARPSYMNVIGFGPFM